MSTFRHGDVDARVKLANIYLHSVIIYAKTTYGLNRSDEEPDEKLMRMLEEFGGITEDKVPDWRRGLYNDYCQNRLDKMYKLLGEAFDYMVQSYEADEWLDRYEVVVPIHTEVLVEKSFYGV